MDLSASWLVSALSGLEIVERLPADWYEVP
jgi:hypothetical protein